MCEKWGREEGDDRTQRLGRQRSSSLTLLLFAEPPLAVAAAWAKSRQESEVSRCHCHRLYFPIVVCVASLPALGRPWTCRKNLRKWLVFEVKTSVHLSEKSSLLERRLKRREDRIVVTFLSRKSSGKRKHLREAVSWAFGGCSVRKHTPLRKGQYCFSGTLVSELLLWIQHHAETSHQAAGFIQAPNVTFRNPWRSMATLTHGVSGVTSGWPFHGDLFDLCTPQWEEQKSRPCPGTGVSVNLLQCSKGTACTEVAWEVHAKWEGPGEPCTPCGRWGKQRFTHFFKVRASNWDFVGFSTNF